MDRDDVAAKPAPLWVDSHAHLTMFAPEETGEVLARACAAGVRGVLVPATNGDDLERAASLAVDHPGAVVAAAGVHPHDAASLDDGLKRRVEEALADPGAVAVGEIGLDYHYMSSPREDQLRALAWQLDLAIAADRPVVLHNRESWDDLEAALVERAGRLRGVCHSFAEGAEAAVRVVELGLFVGFSGMVTFKNAATIREAAAAVPPSRILVETDAPYLAPVPHRGRRNEPAFVIHTAAVIAGLHDLEACDLAEATSGNFRRLFSLGEGWPAS